ncbi:MAG: DUF4197 domain-containing protein [Novosphingobium sp.]|uniref:DUF4197 domain-containing protein n=1 Tax=Novosphingobium sp. TaxID=1874826 RepID=UPI003C7C6B84
MELTAQGTFGRRAFLIGTAATGLLALPGCQSLGGFSMTEAIKRLLTLSSQNAFAKLTAPGGFWDSEVARFDLPTLFSSSGGTLRTLLTSGPFRQGLQKQLNLVAEKGAVRAAPVVYSAIKSVSIADAVGIVRGGPTAATSFLRAEMGSAMINAMIPGLTDALSVSNDPVLGQAIRELAGVDLGQVAQGIANRADNSIWYQIGAEEGAIRANPQSTNDPLLIGVLKVL